MQKHLFLYAWIFALLLLGILMCLGLTLWMLIAQKPLAELFVQSQPMREVFFHAAI